MRGLAPGIRIAYARPRRISGVPEATSPRSPRSIRLALGILAPGAERLVREVGERQLERELALLERQLDLAMEPLVVEAGLRRLRAARAVDDALDARPPRGGEAHRAGLA